MKSALPTLSSSSPGIFDELLCHQDYIWNGIYCVGGEAMKSYFCSNYENCFVGGGGGGGGRSKTETLSERAEERRY